MPVRPQPVPLTAQRSAGAARPYSGTTVTLTRLDEAVVALVALGASSLWASACATDEQTPFSPLERIIQAARDGDPSGLSDVCDPDGRVDSDARRVCDARPSDPRAWELFRSWFADAKIHGLMRGGGGDDDDGVVRVAIAIGPDHRRAEATMVRRGDRWYLSQL